MYNKGWTKKSIQWPKWTWPQCSGDLQKDTVYWRTLLRWTAPQIWHFACGKRIPSQAKLWIYVPVIPNTHTHTPASRGYVQEKAIKKNDISTGHKINSQTLWERHSQAVLPMLRTPRTMSRRNVKLGGKKALMGDSWPKEKAHEQRPMGFGE